MAINTTAKTITLKSLNLTDSINSPYNLNFKDCLQNFATQCHTKPLFVTINAPGIPDVVC